MTDVTVVYLLKDNTILLAMKKRGYGVGKWNGPGGKLQDGESVREGAIRETQEEVGITPELDEPIGVIHFHDQGVGDWLGYAFRTEKFSGQPTESEEMKPQWFNLTDIPYGQMWSGDNKWLPLVIQGKKFVADMWFDGKEKNIKAEIRTL